MQPMSRSTGFRCPSCCAKKGEPHLVDCSRPRQFDSVPNISTEFLIGNCVLSETGEPEDSLTELNTSDGDPDGAENIAADH